MARGPARRQSLEQPIKRQKANAGIDVPASNLPKRLSRARMPHLNGYLAPARSSQAANPEAQHPSRRDASMFMSPGFPHYSGVRRGFFYQDLSAGSRYWEFGKGLLLRRVNVQPCWAAAMAVAPAIAPRRGIFAGQASSKEAFGDGLVSFRYWDTWRRWAWSRHRSLPVADVHPMPRTCSCGLL